MNYRILWLMMVLACLVGCEEEFSRDAHGHPQGTGKEVFRYPSGNKKVEAWFVDGEPTKTRWYSPDGNLFAETRWHDGKGMGYVLRDDGTLAMKGEVVNEVMDGKVWIYDKEGRLVRETTYQNGREVALPERD